MKKVFVIGGIALLALAIVGGVMYSHGNKVTAKEVMYMVSHSEYWTDETGQIIARLYDWQGNPITVDNCTVDVWYPDKSAFKTGELTDDSLQATTGTHWYNFTTPAIEGVYQYMVTCNYDTKSRSVASSFHLSPALNFGTVINQSITDLTAQELEHYNNLQINLSEIDDDLVIIKDDLTEVKTNLSSIRDDTTYIRANMLTEVALNNNMSVVYDNQAHILNNLTAIENFCDDATTSGSSLCLWVDEIKNKVDNINTTVQSYDAILLEINSTTHSTYDYMTGTLAGNINTLLGTTADTQATVGLINTTVNTIESNVSTVIDNQQDVVYMEVTS